MRKVVSDMSEVPYFKRMSTLPWAVQDSIDRAFDVERTMICEHCSSLVDRNPSGLCLPCADKATAPCGQVIVGQYEDETHRAECGCES